MINIILSITIPLVIYGIIIRTVDSGRCFRFEFFIKKIIIYSIFVLLIILSILKSYFLLLFFIYIIIFLVLDIKYTIQRLYDMNVSGWYILLLSIPVINTLTTLALFFTKGNREINDYDKAIDYKKLFKNRHCINILNNLLIIDNNEYQYEQYINKFTIKISKYGIEDFFTDYLYKNYHVNEDGIYKSIEITSDEFKNLIKNLNLLVINDSFYVNIKDVQLFIRKEDFKFTIIINRKNNNISNEILEDFHFPGSFFEDENNIYYIRINKNDLLVWVKNIA